MPTPILSIKRLYHTARWKRMRGQQLASFPLCAVCSTPDRPVAATVVHHVELVGTDEVRFFTSPLQSLCAGCHGQTHGGAGSRGYSLAIGIDGFPLDNRHPFYRHG